MDVATTPYDLVLAGQRTIRGTRPVISDVKIP
jgi:hypothetical protein